MLIKKRGKTIFEVLTIKDFESFIVNESFYKYFIKFDDSHKKEIQELIEKTDFQRASKVRSAKGLLVHVFGKLAAAFIYLIFNP
jgi:hypothetical protein